MMEVVYACNEDYLEQTIISVISLLKYNPRLKVHLVADSIKEDKINFFINKVSDYSKDVDIILIESLLGAVKLSEKDRHPRTIYAKLFLDEILSCNKVLYIDSDIIVNGSLEELENRNMDNELAAGVIMPYSTEIKEKHGISKEDAYICDGMVLINLDNWRKQSISDKCRERINACKGNPYMLSEGILNYVGRGQIGILEPAYNLMPSMIFFTREQIVKMFEPVWYYSRGQLESAKNTPKMIHFMKELYNRPWFEPCDHPYKKYYRDLDNEVFECGKEYEKVDISFRTKVNKWLYRMLPFELYLLVYRLMKNNG